MATKPRITINRLRNGRDLDGSVMHYGSACIVISTDAEETYEVWEKCLESEYPGWKKHCSDCAEHNSFPDGQDSYDVFWYIPSDELGEFRAAYNAVKKMVMSKIRKNFLTDSPEFSFQTTEPKRGGWWEMDSVASIDAYRCPSSRKLIIDTA